MREHEEKFKQYLAENNINAEQYIFDAICHTVEEAACAANVTVQDLVKNICMIDNDENLIVGIVKGEDRVSTSRVAKVLNIDAPRAATPDEILEKTGYVCGGVPSFGYEAIYLIDPKVMEKEFIITGGGSPYALLKIKTSDLLQINKGQIVRIRK